MKHTPAPWQFQLDSGLAPEKNPYVDHDEEDQQPPPEGHAECPEGCDGYTFDLHLAVCDHCGYTPVDYEKGIAWHENQQGK